MTRFPLLVALSAALSACSSTSEDGAGKGGTPDASIDGASVPSVAPPASWADADFIDVHTHCEAIVDCDGELCCDFSGWQALQSSHRGRAVMLANEYWAINAELVPPEIGEYFDGLNDKYLNTALRHDEAITFIGLRCLYQEKLDDTWADKCKAEAREWISKGALGFKDHIGKQFQGDGQEGAYFLGGWNRFNGFCDVPPSSQTPNSDCMLQPTVRYLALEPAWREVLRYIVEELKVPVVSHASSWQGGKTQCYDPEIGDIGLCPAITIRQQEQLGEWFAANVDASARRRLIFAHLGFLTEDLEGLRRLLDTGVSLDTARFDNLTSVGCGIRDLVAAYPNQLVLGSDRRVDQACLPGTYDAWLHILGGPADATQSFTACRGPVDALGAELGSPTVAGCADVPTGALDRVLKTNFLTLYE